MRDRLKSYIPVGAGLFTVWIANGQLEAFHAKLNNVCYKTDPNGAYGDCNFDSTLLFLACLLAGVGVGTLTHYFVVKEHK